MPPRRGRGRKSAAMTKKEEQAAANLDESFGSTEDTEMSENAETNGTEAGEPEVEPMEEDPPKTAENGKAEEEEKPSEDDVSYPNQIKVSAMPAIYAKEDFVKYLASTFKVMVPKILSPKLNNPWVLLCFKDKEQQENLLRVLDNHVWRKKTLHAIPWLPLENRKRKREDGEDDQELKKNKTEEEQTLTLEEEIVSESLPLLNVSYDEQRKRDNRHEKPWMTEEIKKLLSKGQVLYRQWKGDPENNEKRELYKMSRNESTKLIKLAKARQGTEAIWYIELESLDGWIENENRLSRQDAELMSERLHGLLCAKNKDLAGWAEKSCDDNGGTLFKLEPLKTSPNIRGYRTKCKFRIGKNDAGESTVGFYLSDYKNKILEVEPGDKLIHLPDNMKGAAKKFQEFVRGSGKEAYDKKTKTGVWDNLLIRIAPDGGVMLVVVVGPNALDEATLEKAKEDLVAFYTTGSGKDSGVFSIYLQVLSENNHNYLPNKLHLVWGKPEYEEIICGLKFHVSPFSILNINPCSSENIYNSVLELAELTPDTVVIDVCAGSCGIAFTCAKHCEKAFAIEPQEDNFKDAEKTKTLNNITNVEIIKGKCEENLDAVFDQVKDKNVVVVLDPPRHGVIPKVVGLIRARANVKKVIYVCSNTKTGVRNFLDLAAPEGKEATSGVEMTGLPFLPTRAIPIDIAPYTVNNTVPVLLERVDASTFPPATKPPPEPVKKEVSKNKKNPQGRRRRLIPGGGIGGRGSMRGVRGGGVRGMRGRGPPPRGFQVPPFMRPPMRAPPLMGRGGGMGPMRGGRGGRWNDSPNLISKYERRIAELEEQDRAFKAGLSMGLQALNRSGGMGGGMGGGMNSSPRNMGDYSTGEAFGGYRGGYKDPYGDNSSPWQSNVSFQNRSNNSPYGSHATGGGGGGGFGGNRGGNFSRDDNYNDNSYGGGYNSSRPGPLAGSRFVGVGGNQRSGPNQNRYGGGGGGGGGGNQRGGNSNRRGTGRGMRR